MCNAFSCIMKSDLTIVPCPNPDIHSHTRQAELAGVLDMLGTEAYQRLECVPADDDYSTDAMTWIVKVDEERKASWVEEHWPEIEDRVRVAATRWAKARIVRDDTPREVKEHETVIVLAGNGVTVNGGWAKFYGTSVCEEHSGGDALFYGTSVCKQHSGGAARFFGTSVCKKHSGGEAWFFASSVCKEHSGGMAQFFGTSVCKKHSGGEAWFFASSVCKEHSGGRATFVDTSVCKQHSGGLGQFKDSSVCDSHTGGTMIRMARANGTWTEVSREVKPDKKGTASV